MIGGAVHSANAVKTSRKAGSDSDTQETPSITSIVDTLESHKRIGPRTTLELVIMLRGIRIYEGGIRLSWGKAVAQRLDSHV